jgi:hypothetical protein
VKKIKEGRERRRKRRKEEERRRAVREKEISTLTSHILHLTSAVVVAVKKTAQ